MDMLALDDGVALAGLRGKASVRSRLPNLGHEAGKGVTSGSSISPAHGFSSTRRILSGVPS
jgi:hypothetical protein